FQAPISEYGEIREQYRLTNMLHMFVNDFGDILAPMEAVEPKTNITVNDLSSLRYCMRTDGNSGFVFINHYQRSAKMKDIHNVVIDTGKVQFPPITICDNMSFFLPFYMDLSGNLLEYATTQPLCQIDDTYFFAAIDGIEAEYKFTDGSRFDQEPDNILKRNGIQIVTLSWDRAKYARKLSDTLYIGDNCDLYEYDGNICSVQDGDFAYDKWNGSAFEHVMVQQEWKQADITFESVDEPFTPPYADELNIGGERKRIWKKVSVSNDIGFIDIQDQYDVAQIYADGEFVADNFYYGKPWRVPARMLYGKVCYLVMSEMKDDFYREF
ncbi:MAG: hypothetical protein HDR30_05865, partial [Lachnospiraceae bacterium]|nr:hypothetical protein [Lachnospiraceae bacterium]